jgi:Domain of unknown function (DUF1887)
MDIKKEVEGSLYVMASTLNQMVNYIPCEYFQFKKIWNITTDDPKNQDWDKYFEAAIKKNRLKIDSIEFKQTILLKIDEIKRRLTKELEDKYPPNQKIFWNITGGQRPVLMAVYDLVRALVGYTHYLCYLEGNSGKMSIMKFEGGKRCDEITNSYVYNIDGLTIDIALKLMGYAIKGVKTGTISTAVKPYIDLWNLYIKDSALRIAFVKSNTKNGNIDDVKQVLVNPSLHFILDNHKDKEYPFGYILEEMVVAVLQEKFKGKIAQIEHSLKLEFDNETENKAVGHKQLDEFDILLLTKTGQLYNFECKSGGMSGDVAKSTKYSTYALSGVYGKPILIAPLIETELKTLDKLSDDYNYVTAAIRSAKRATLEVWGVDGLVSRIDKKIN